MEALSQYIKENYTLDGITAWRFIESLLDYVNYHMTEAGELTPEGMNLIESVIADNIGMDKQEIIENW